MRENLLMRTFLIVFMVAVCLAMVWAVITLVEGLR
jgi:hypothetical protein